MKELPNISRIYIYILKYKTNIKIDKYNGEYILGIQFGSGFTAFRLTGKGPINTVWKDYSNVQQWS